MGWTFTVKAQTNTIPNGVGVQGLIDELNAFKTRAELAYAGLVHKQVLVDGACQVVAKWANENAPGLYSTRGKGGKGPDNIQINYKPTTPILTLELTQNPSASNACPACGRNFTPDPNVKNSKWTAAHNVIPASLWFKIVPEALLNLVDLESRKSTLAAEQRRLAQGTKKALQVILDSYKRGGFKDNAPRSGATLEMFVATLCRVGADCGGPGSSGNEPQTGAQCPACETLHGSDSLIRRIKPHRDMQGLVQAVADPAVGIQFLDYIARNPGLAQSDRTPELITLSVIDMVLSGMEGAVKQRGAKDEYGMWLKELLTTSESWEEFEENVRVFALHYCCEQ